MLHYLTPFYLKKPLYSAVFAVFLLSGCHLLPDQSVFQVMTDTQKIAELQTSAEKGNAQAQYELAMLHIAGQKLPKDDKKAYNLLTKSANSGYAKAQTELGRAYSKGSLGVAKNNYTALQWIKKAAKQGDPQAEYSMGLAYYNGIGVKKDTTEAFNWQQKAANKGFSQAQFALGTMYEAGVGTPQDYQQAVHWYQKAANQGDPKAQFNLGLLYLQGNEIEKDEASAKSLFKSACDKGSQPGCTMYQKLSQ